jgi:hypothetical protein
MTTKIIVITDCNILSYKVTTETSVIIIYPC